VPRADPALPRHRRHPRPVRPEAGLRRRAPATGHVRRDRRGARGVVERRAATLRRRRSHLSPVAGAPVSVAFVLGGGGHAGAAEVGMLHALLERDLRPDLIVGTSVGALHGAMVAVDPTVAAVEKLEAAWSELAELGVLGRS